MRLTRSVPQGSSKRFVSGLRPKFLRTNALWDSAERSAHLTLCCPTFRYIQCSFCPSHGYSIFSESRSIISSMISGPNLRPYLFTCPPGHHLPKNHRTTKHIDLVIVSRFWAPQLRGLPINSADERSDHTSCCVFDPSETKVTNLANAPIVDQNV